MLLLLLYCKQQIRTALAASRAVAVVGTRADVPLLNPRNGKGAMTWSTADPGTIPGPHSLGGYPGPHSHPWHSLASLALTRHPWHSLAIPDTSLPRAPHGTDRHNSTDDATTTTPTATTTLPPPPPQPPQPHPDMPTMAIAAAPAPFAASELSIAHASFDWAYLATKRSDTTRASRRPPSAYCHGAYQRGL